MSETCQKAVAIGASAGAIEAITPLLRALPADFERCVLVVIHVPPNRNSLLAEVLQPKCRLHVHEAEDKEPLLPGHVYLAPPDYHMLVERDKRISLSSEEAVHFSRPAIDLTFCTAAEAFGDQVVGVILSGANEDGATGLQEIERVGGQVIVQRPDLALAPEMPTAALAACKRPSKLTLEEIANLLCNY
jgi:two-component system chemotaxis response regulator CheB